MSWDELTASDTVESAQWIRDRLHAFAKDVGSVVPAGLDSYARIFHPAWWSEDNAEIEVRWSDVAAWSGRTVHAEMQFHSIAVPVPGRQSGPLPWSGEPRLGILSREQASALIGLLAKHTSTPERCWFCLWDGYGYLTGAVVTFAAQFWTQGEPRPHFRPRAAIRPPRPKLEKSRVRLPIATTFCSPVRSQVAKAGKTAPIFGGLTTAVGAWRQRSTFRTPTSVGRTS